MDSEPTLSVNSRPGSSVAPTQNLRAPRHRCDGNGRRYTGCPHHCASSGGRTPHKTNQQSLERVSSLTGYDPELNRIPNGGVFVLCEPNSPSEDHGT